MCARIIQNVEVHALGRIYRIQTDNTHPQIPIRWNGPPGGQYAVCRMQDEQREIVPIKWGLVPAWARSDDFAPHNARAETAATKPTFRDAWRRRRRCILPVNGWYEWRRQIGKGRVPCLIGGAEDEVLHVAALWDRWNGPQGPVDSFAVLTTIPRLILAAIHHRQPAVLDTASEIDDWLDPRTPAHRVQTLARQSGTQPLRIHEVSTAVNDPRNDGPFLLNATTSIQPGQ